jgi:CheY-like chemotaxis protein/nitrogen-specific signal transduction histidine kinase
VFDAEGEITEWFGAASDVTDRKRAEEALRESQHEAEAANRAKDHFLAMLSHELRTPLTPVLLTVAALRRDPVIGGELRRDLDVIERNVSLEARLIDDLLDLTRITHGKLELQSDAVDLHTVLDHALSISSADIQKKNISVTRSYQAPEHHTWGDATRLQQVFWNLIRNAVKFTPPGGSVAVSTRTEDGRIIAVIGDSGIGIDPNNIARIFDAFEQGSRRITASYGGLGLGLAISKRVVDLHGGSITAASEGVGMGATFTVTLAAMATSLLNQPVDFVDFKPNSPGYRILLVEDHEDTARVLRRILHSAGHVVTVTAGVATAKAVAARNQFDLVISDLGLPDGSGLDLMRHLRAEHNLSGIAMSGYGMDEDVGLSKDAGFAEHLTKPVDWEHLQAAILRVADCGDLGSSAGGDAA